MSAPKLSFHQIVEHFAPGWFATVMGTGVLSIALFAFRQSIPFASAIQSVFLWLAVLLFIVLLVPWLTRWIQHPEAVRRDLQHPVSAAFFPTMPISLLVIGVALEKTSPSFLSESALWSTLLILWMAGAAGILFFALSILNIFFHQPELKWEAATFGWLIPPVSTLLIPVLGFSLAGHYAASAWGAFTLFVSLMFTGVGTLLFLFVMGTVFTRYVFYALPPVQLAPTLMVGVAPTSILTIIVLRLVKPAQAVMAFSPQVAETLNAVAAIAAVALWGFALFWLILAALVTLEVHRKTPLPFALSWWAFIFPLGAFAVASGALYQAAPFGFFLWSGLLVLAGVMVMWLVTLIRTLHGAWQGKLFVPHHAPQK